MGGIELLGTVCALWGNISQENCSGASQHQLARNFPSSGKAFEGFEGIRDQQGNLPRLLLQPSMRLLAKGLVWIWLCHAKTQPPSMPFPA